MKIDPLHNSGHINRPHVNGRANGHAAAGEQTTDRLSTELSNKVREAFASIPEIRPDVVERGHQLRVDPNYPSQEIVEKIARLITPFSEE